jgi:multidrug efflux system membrane fusion protein
VLIFLDTKARGCKHWERIEVRYRDRELNLQLRAFLMTKASRPIVFTVVAVLGLGVGYRLLHASAAPAPATVSPPIPVQTAIAKRADVPIYFDGLGTVQAFNTITVTTRVDGQLQAVNFVEGQSVRTGEVLAQIDPRPYRAALEQAVAIKAKDKAQLANAQLDLQRYTALASQNAISAQMLATQAALVAQLEAQVKMDKAAIDLATTNLDYTTIRSPIDGLTGIRLVDAGNNMLAAANTSLAVLTQMHPISVVFTLPEEDLPAITKNTAASLLPVIALSRDLKTELDRGTVAVVDNQILQATGTVRLKATFPNSKNTLWPGQFVNARLLIETQRDVLTIPSPAVQRGPNGLYTYIVKSDSTVEIRALRLAEFSSGQAIIESGLRPGERVVTAGQYRLKPGDRIQNAGQSVASAVPDQPVVSGQIP